MKKIILGMSVLSSSAFSATTINGFDLSAYGFIRASSLYATEGLASFNNINMVAPTHAVAQTTNSSKTSRMSFQAQQSRVGLNLKKGEISSKLEFDFVDFNKSSPTTQMVPRVRIANVTYAWENHKIIIGQDWDLFSPTTALTYNYVGGYFLAGNTGFMRQQAQYLNTQGEWELGAAIGMAGNNPGTADGDLELSKSPTYALRLARKLENGRVGLSGIYARTHFEADDSSHDAYGANVFFEKSLGKWAMRSEAYYGQNLANLGSLSIGKGIATTNEKEYGGFLTTSYDFSEKSTFSVGAGTAKSDSSLEVTPYAISATGSIASQGLLGNFVSRMGHEYRVTNDLSWVVEVSRYETKTKLSVDKSQTFVVHSFETGIQLRF